MVRPHADDQPVLFFGAGPDLARRVGAGQAVTRANGTAADAHEFFKGGHGLALAAGSALCGTQHVQRVRAVGCDRVGL